MGLAASQAKLLSITARMHDTEFQAQDIMQKKVDLATQKDELAKELEKAYDAKILKVQVSHNGVLNFVDADFATMCGYNPDRKETYALTDPSSGEMVVSDDVYEAYQNFRGGDKYAFAYEMMGFDDQDGFPTNAVGSSFCIGVNTDGEYCYDGNESEYAGQFKDSETGETVGYVIMSDVEASVYELHKSELEGDFNKVKETINKPDVKCIDVQKAIETFRKALYSNNTIAQEIFEGMAKNSIFGEEAFEDFDRNEFNHYVKIFEGIEAAGGCVPISEYAKDGVTDSDWFSNIVQSGQLLLNQYKTGANKGWQTISKGTCTTIQEVPDETRIKKAELKYERELEKIKTKEQGYDRDLNKLETERTALNTERESVEKVINDNIERTFGIFS